MKRFIVLHENRTYADGWLLWLIVVLGALLLALALATTAAAGTAYYSFEGWLVEGDIPTQYFAFDVDRGLARPAPFSLRTWHYGGTPTGQTNAAGDTIPGGSFDPILRLYYLGGPVIVVNDDGPSGLDSLINWSTPGMPEQLAAGSYGLDLVPFSGEGPWAVNLQADAARFTLTNAGGYGSDYTPIYSLKIGSDDTRVPAMFELASSRHLEIYHYHDSFGRLVVGKTGGATAMIAGDLDTGHSVFGWEPGSVGSMTLDGHWRDNHTYDATYIGLYGEGNLDVRTYGDASFGYNLVLAKYLGSEGNVTVSGPFSDVDVYSKIEIGAGGTGTLRVDNQGRLYSYLLGNQEADVVASLALSTGTVDIDGYESLWETDPLIVGDAGQGIVRVTNGGKIDTHGSAYIGKTSSAASSSVTVTGMSPELTKATWLVSGNLYIAGDEAGPSSAAFSRLAISPGGLVDVFGTTTVWNNGGSLELLGGELETGSLFVNSGGVFTHDDGMLTVDGGTFHLGVDNHKIDGADAADLPVVKLINGAIASVSTSFIGNVIVGDDYRGRLEILSSSRAELGRGLVIGQFDSGNGEVIVDGQGSQLTSVGYGIGYYGRGVLRILGGGTVIDTVAFEYESIGQFGGSVGIVEVAGTALDGTPSTWTPRSQLRIGDSGHGTLTISAGGRVNAVAGAAIATYSSAAGSSATVTGLNSRWAITGPLYVGGNDASAGGSGKLTVASNGQVTAGSVKVWQPGTVELDNNGIISTGNFELAGGTLQGIGTVLVSGQLANAGVVSPGVFAPALSTDLIIVEGDYTQNTAGELDIEIGGTAPSDYDRLIIENGSASLHGKLAVSLVDTGGGTDVFQPSAGETFEILVAANGLGGTTFATEVLPALRGGLYFGVLYNQFDVTLVAAGVLGDYNRNGAVDAADYVVWRNTFSGPNVPASSLAADGDGDGDVDANDQAVWRSHFGQTAGSGAFLAAASASDTIPEPSAILLLALGVSVCVLTTRRKRMLGNEYVRFADGR